MVRLFWNLGAMKSGLVRSCLCLWTRHRWTRDGLTRLSSGSASASYYSLLGVGRDATKAEIKSAFLTLSKLHHPDLNPASKSEEAHQKFREINEAYSVLMDPARRSTYDQQFYGHSTPHFSSPVMGRDEERFGFYQYNPRANAYMYARAYQYYDFNDREWQELYRSSSGGWTRKSHFRVIQILVVLMVTGTLLHGTRIYFTHKNHKRKADRDSKKNRELYEAVRERGRTSSVQEQLNRLSHTRRNSQHKERQGSKE